MSAVETDPKPLAAEPPAAPLELTPAPAVDSSTEAPAAAEATVAETPAVASEAQPETATETPALAAETTEEKKEEAKVEPIYSGTLGYKVHHQGFDIKGLISGPKKRFFWFGEDAPITTQNLNTYLRGEKPKIAHPAAAWSSKTGKGLLYYVKHADDKATPTGVLLLADVIDVTEAPGLPEFSFKLDGAKHSFEAKNKAEASSWVLALKEKIEEAKSLKEEVQESSEYKDASSHLNKPVTAGLAAAGAAGVAAKKDDKEAVETPAEAAATDKPVEKESKKSKSRSVSRGNKRQSIFGNILGKKDDAEEKVKEKKEEKAEAKETKKEEEDAAAVPTVAAVEETPAAATEPKAEEIAVAPAAEIAPAAEATDAAAVAETKPVEETTPAPPTTKAGKRGSIFGNFFEKVRSPTHEKKESEVAPTVPPKDEVKDKELPEAPVEAETAAIPVIAEPATTEAAAAPADEEAAVEEKPVAPQPERKSSLFGKLTQKLRSPSSERAPVLASEPKEESNAEAPVSATTEAAPATEAVVAPVTETKAEETAPAVEEPKTDVVDAEKKEEVPEKRKSSFFGSVKKDKVEGSEGGEKKGLGGLFRNPSKLIKGHKEGKKAAAPAKVEEETKVSDEAPKLDEPKTEAPLDTKTEEPAQTQSIGDVVPAAVQVGQPQTVSATA